MNSLNLSIALYERYEDKTQVLLTVDEINLLVKIACEELLSSRAAESPILAEIHRLWETQSSNLKINYRLKSGLKLKDACRIVSGIILRLELEATEDRIVREHIVAVDAVVNKSSAGKKKLFKRGSVLTEGIHMAPDCEGDCLKDVLRAVGDGLEKIKALRERIFTEKERVARWMQEIGGTSVLPEEETDVQTVAEELGEPLTEADAERIRAVRQATTARLVEAWHGEISSLDASLKAMQPQMSQMLGVMMHFSDNVTEKYVFQFAKMLINIYDKISDAYDYHESVAGNSGNRDYLNAVRNYDDYKYMIEDCLAAFGVDVILSSDGAAFDGAIHEVKNGGRFDPRTARVLRSLRCGFRYGDLVFKKEAVALAEA